MTKPAIPFRIPDETARQLSRLMAYEGQDNKSALLVACIEERYSRQHTAIHYELRMSGRLLPGDATTCPWCGYVAPDDD